jgi:3-oxoadipate enol-lactonase|tara:strand:- start:953 stop:1759 length:807 start_codon:yes stop_codon:yes gene_type:complete
MSLIETHDLSIYYERSSKQSNGPLLYIGGTGGDLRNRPNQLDSPLKDSFEIISYDQRGLGQTSKPENEYTMKQYANDAADFIDKLGFSSLPVMGVSFGGMVAQELAIRHPDKVTKLVLACTSSGGKGGSSYPLHELEELDPEKKLETGIKINDLRITDEWTKENPKEWGKLKELSVNRIQYKPEPSGLKNQLLARKDHDTTSRLTKIKAPVLLAGGKYDGIAPIKNMEYLHRNIKCSTLKFYEGGHLFLIQDKLAFKEIIEWLIRIDE